MNETDNGDYSNFIERKNVYGTPFTRIKIEKGYFLTLGSYRITDIYDTKEDIDKAIENKEWDMLITVILALIHLTKEHPDILTMTK